MRVVTYRTRDHESRSAIFTEERWQVSEWNGREWQVLGGADEDLLRALRFLLNLGKFGEGLMVEDIRYVSAGTLKQARDAFNASERRRSLDFLQRATVC